MDAMQHYGEFNFWEECIKPKLPDSNTSDPIFIKRIDKDESLVIMDPLNSAGSINLTKSTRLIKELKDLFNDVYQGLTMDCTCGIHRTNSYLLYPYKKRFMNFTDKNHCLLSKVFAIALAHSRPLIN